MKKGLLRAGLLTSIWLLGFTFMSAQEPAYNTGYPTITHITPTTATAEVNATVGGTTGVLNSPTHITFFLIKLANEESPSIEEIIDSALIQNRFIPLTSPNTTFSKSPSNLSAGTNYIAFFVTTDAEGTPVLETTEPTQVSFSTPAPPTISSLSPADDAASVPMNSDLVITFNEPIKAGDPLKGLEIYKTSDSQSVFTINASDANISGNELTINNIDFVSSLDYNTSYYILIDAGFVRSIDTGIDFGGVSDNTTWNFTTEAAPPPSIASLSPENNAINVPVGITLTLTFEKSIQFNPNGTFSINIFSPNEEVPISFEEFEIVNGTPPSGVSILDNQIFINPSSNFEFEKNYYINIESNSIQSTAGVSFGGISDNYTWNFTTEAAPLPSIASLSPENNATDVPVDATLTLTFEKNIQFNPDGTFNIGIFIPTGEEPILFEGFQIVDGTPPSGVSILGNQIIINPSSNFDYEKNYYINIESNLIQSTEGASFGGISDNSTWSFTTEAVPPPSIASLSPENNATDVPLDITLTLTFDQIIQFNPIGTFNIVIFTPNGEEPILFEGFQIVEGSLPIGVSISDNQIFIDPSSDFDFEKNYYINIESNLIQSTEGVSFGGISDNSTWSFTTEAAPAPPSIISLSPENNATDVPVDATLTLTFDANIKANPLSSDPAPRIYVKNKADGSIVLEYAVSEGVFKNTSEPTEEVSIFENSLVINPPANFDFSTDYYVTIDNGCLYLVSDVDNLYPFAGFSDNTIWSFTTQADPASPTLMSSTPINNATDVEVDATLTLTFNDNIKANPLSSIPAPRIYVKNKADDSIVLEYAVSGGVFENDEVTISGNDLIINPPANFNFSTGYYVTIENGCLYPATDDANSHPFAGFSDNSTWSFTTLIDPASPTLMSSIPINNATDVEVDATLTLTFNDNIKANPLSSIPAPRIYVKKKADDSIVLEYAVSGDAFENEFGPTGEVTIFESNLVINPPADFDFFTEYYVTIENGCLYLASDEANSHPFAGFSDNSTWSFTTMANPASPHIVEPTTPIDDTTDVPLNQDLIIIFDRDIQAGLGVMTIYREDDSNFQSFNANDATSLSYSGSQLTIATGDFEPGTSYYVLIPEGFVESTEGVPFAGILNKTKWNFTAADSPIPTAFSPLDEANDVAIDQELVITFDRDIAKGSSGSIDIFYDNGADFQTIGTSSTSYLRISGNQLIIKHLDFKYDSAYYVKISEGFVMSASGAPFAGISDTTVWNFTAQRRGPVWAPDYPNLSNQNAVSLTLNGQTDSDGYYFFVITDSPTSPTPQQIAGGQDENGNSALPSGFGSMTANSPFSREINISTLTPEHSYYLHVVTRYQTVYSESRVRGIDRFSPTLYPQSVPRNGATNVPINIIINFQFSEKIFALDGTEINTGNASYYFDLLENTNSVGHSIEVSPDGRSITITPTGDLLENTGYKVAMELFEDQYGNQQTNVSSFTFETDKINRWSGGGGTGVWGEPTNWEDGFVENKSVLIPNPLSTVYPTINTGDIINVYNLTVEAGASLTHTAGILNIGGRFTLESSTDGNASYLPQGGTLNVKADSVRFEQLVTNPNYNYFVSSPVSGATMRSMGLTETMYYFDNPTDSYILQGNTEPLVTGRGYVFRNNSEIVFTGTPNSEDKTINVVRTANKGLGWNLIGNPFSATINWNNASVLKNNVENSFWMWLNDDGHYATFNGFSELGIFIDDPYIPSHHSIWVKVVTGLPNNTGSVVFPTSALEANTTSYLKSGSKGSTKFPSLKLASRFNNHIDETAIALAPEATIGIDVFDSDKFFSNNPNFCEVFTLAGNQPLAINGLPQAEEMEISLGYSVKTTGTCEFSIALNTLLENSEVFIKDKTLNTITKITEGISYPFEINATGKNTTRFALVLKNGTVTGIKGDDVDKDINKPYIYTGKSEIVVIMPEGQRSRYQLFGLDGKILDNGILNAGAPNKIAVSHKGMVILRIEWEGGIEEYKAVF